MILYLFVVLTVISPVDFSLEMQVLKDLILMPVLFFKELSPVTT